MQRFANAREAALAGTPPERIVALGDLGSLFTMVAGLLNLLLLLDAWDRTAERREARP